MEQLLTGKNMTFAGSILVVLSVLRRPLLEFWKSVYGQRLLPVAPLLLGVGGSFAGMTDGVTWQDKVMLGLICGFTAGHMFKVGKTSLLGYGLDSEEEIVPPTAPEAVIPNVVVSTSPAIVLPVETKKE